MRLELVKTLLVLSATALLAGCAEKPGASVRMEAAPPSVKAVETAKSEQDQSVKFLFANPGPFKLVTDKDGNELWQARGETGKFGGSLKLISFGAGPKTFNAWDASDVESHGIGMIQNDSLVDIDPWTGRPIPKLCKSVDVSKDGKVVTFVLRKGLKWSDGKPITADDVVFTFGTIIKDGFGEGSNKDTISVPEDYPTIKKLDELTTQFIFKKPFSPLLPNINACMLAPKHIFEPVVKKGHDAFRPFWNVNANLKGMVGSGPFILSEYVPGQRVEFKRNPYYHMVDKEGRRLPYLDKIVIAIVPDQGTMVMKFEGGEVDLLDVREVRGMDAARLRKQESEGNFTLRSLGPDDGTVFLMFNMAQRKNPATGKYYVDPIKQRWFNNLNFRQAVSCALDRQSVVNNILKGVGYSLSTCQTSAGVYHNKSLAPIVCDLKKSEQLLKDGGFVKKEGSLYDDQGNKVEFELLTNAGNNIRDAVCIHIKEQLKKLGIKVNYQPVEFNAMINRTHTSLDWQAMMLGLSGSRLEPYSGANVWKSDGRMHEFDTRLPGKDDKVVVTDARPWEKEIDKCLDTAAGSFDETVRRANYEKAEAIAYEQQPFIYIYTTMLLTAARNNIGNYKPTHYGIYYTPKGTLHNMEEIYLKDVKAK